MSGSEGVPPGPYFHGTRAQIPTGAALHVGTVDPAFGDDREMTWATTDVAQALRWAYERNRHGGSTLYVYEVELDSPEVDTNVHDSNATPAEIHSVMAASGRVTRVAEVMDATGYERTIATSGASRIEPGRDRGAT